MTKNAGFLILALILGLAASADAAVIYLKDGATVTGTVVNATAHAIEISTPSGQTERIPVSRIARIDYQGTAAPSAPAAPAAVPPPPPGYGYRRRRAPTGFEAGRQEVSLSVGLAAPLTDVDFSSIGGSQASNGATGPSLGGQYLYFPTERLGFGGEVSWLHRSATSTQSLVPDGDTNVWGNTVLLLAMLKYSLIGQGRVRPYISAGLGPDYTSTNVNATPDPGFSWSDTLTNETRTLYSDSTWGFASTVRLGLDFASYWPSFFSLEAGWTLVANPGATPTQDGQNLGLGPISGTIDFFTFQGRWGWRF